MEKYYVVVKGHPPIEITQEQFMAAEWHHGFRSKYPGSPATGGFGAGPVVQYTVRYSAEATPLPARPGPPGGPGHLATLSPSMLTPNHKFLAGNAYHAPPTPARVVEGPVYAPRRVASLTLFRNAMANLNGEAVALLAPATAVALGAPHSPGARWVLMPASAQQPGALPLHADRGRQRFRAFALATALFAAVPATQKTVVLALRPAPGAVFELVVG